MELKITAEINHNFHVAGVKDLISSSTKEILAELHSSKQQTFLIGAKLMATLEEVQAAIDTATADAAAEAAEVVAVIQSLSDQITSLQAQLANGTVVTAADLDGLLLRVAGLDSAIKGIVEPTPAPVV